jgi:hypothetical protein
MDSYKVANGIVGTIVFFIAYILGFVGYFFKGFVLVKYWEWFIVEHWEVSALSFPAAVGIIAVIDMLKTSIKDMDDSKDKDFKEGVCNCLSLQVVNLLVYLPLLLLGGKILSWFV